MSSTTPVLDPISTLPADPELSPPLNRLSHIVQNKDKLAEAIINRTAIEALCGYVFVPEQAPSFPVCERCKDVYASMTIRDDGGAGWES